MSRLLWTLVGLVLLADTACTTLSNTEKIALAVKEMQCTPPSQHYSALLKEHIEKGLDDLVHIPEEKIDDYAEQKVTSLLTYFHNRIDVDFLLYSVCSNNAYSSEQSRLLVERIFFLYEKSMLMDPDFMNAVQSL